MPFCLSLCFFMALGSMMTPLGAVEHSKSGNEQHSAQTVKQVLSYIEANSDYVILYSKDLLEALDKQVSIPLDGEKVEKILEKLASAANLECKINGRQVVVAPKAVAGQAPQQSGNVKVTGQIIDEKGESIPGANISVKGQSGKGTVSDMDGNFTLNVPRGSVLVVSFVGFVSTEYKVDGPADNLKLQLHPDAETLDEVVVVGYGMQRQSSITGAISSVKADELKGITTPSVSNLLQGKVAGVVATSTSGQPGAGVSIRIRGTGSIQGNQEALWVIDGVVGSSSAELNPNDIESISILKDGSATALYGSRGANGVIVVTTKEPEPGKLKIQAQVGLNVELPDLSSYDLLNAADKLRLEKMVGLYEIEDHPSRQFQYDQYYDERLRRVLSGVDVDWLSKPLRNGIGQRYNLRLEGGSEQFRWATALKYNETAGAMKGSSRRVFTGDITLMYRVKNLIFRNYTSISTTKGVESKYGSFQNYVNQQPYNEPYDENGQLVRYFDNLTHSAQVQNPLYDASLNTFDESRDLGIINNFSIEWNILDGLTLRGQLGISADHTTSDYFLPAEHSYFNTVSYNTMMGSLRKGLYDYSTGDSYSFDGNVTLSYSKLFADRHQVYVGLDYSMAEDHSKLYTFSAEGYTNDDLSSLANARQYAENSAPGGSRSTSRRLGFTGNVNYTYDNRYYIDGSYRVDGSSQFGSNKRYAPFWSVGVGWNIHNEKALFGNKTLNNLRIKASYGVTGSLDFSASNVMTTYKYYTDSRYLNWSGAQLLGLGNPDLTWQSTKQWNVGLEFGLFQNRIKGEFNVYNKITNNLLSSMDLPRSMGFPSYVANVGEVKNVGYEASLTAYLIRDEKRDLNWMISAQLVYDKNKITRLSEAIKAQNELYLKENVEVSKLFYEGRPQNSLYAVRSLGIDPSYGYEMFLDKDGNITRTWNPSDKVYMGGADPLYRGNASTMLMWKDFTFNISFGYHWGGKMYNSTLRDRVEVSTGVIASRNVDARVLSDRWKQPGDAVFFKNFDNTGSTYATSRYIMDDNVFEIQTISLQYRWHSEYLRKVANLQTILFGLNMSNVAYFSSTKYERGTDYPFARNLVGTITFMF